MAMHPDEQYQKLLRKLLEEGSFREERTGTGAYSIFGYQMRFDLCNSFPLLTTKKLHTKSIFAELLWMLRGETNVKSLQEQGVTIWDEWADEDGELGPVYGAQWRNWRGAGESYTDSDNLNSTVYVDQINGVLKSLKENPFSRRHIVTAWNPADVNKMALPPCHCLFQFFVAEMNHGERLHEYARLKILEGLAPVDESNNALLDPLVLDAAGVPRLKLSCQLYQRSCDSFLGVPYNIASYALLTRMFAQQLGYAPAEFVWTGGDVHLYSNHVEQAKLQLQRFPYFSPQLKLRKAPSLFGYTLEDVEVIGYQSHPHIKADVAV